MNKRIVDENSEALVDNDNAAEFHKSLKELRQFSSQLYHAADYCKTAFLSSKDKNQILETTKEYVARAVVVVVDHLGTMSANLECCISKSTCVSETECKLERLKQRIGTCQDYSFKISLHRFHRAADFSRYHCRYVSPPSKDLTVSSSVSCYSRSCIDAENEEETPFEAVEPSVVESSSSGMKKENLVPALLNSTRDYKKMVPVDDDGLSPLPRTKNSVFQFQEADKIKRGTMNWKAMVQNKDIAAFIKRGKRILA